MEKSVQLFELICAGQSALRNELIVSLVPFAHSQAKKYALKRGLDWLTGELKSAARLGLVEAVDDAIVSKLDPIKLRAYLAQALRHCCHEVVAEEPSVNMPRSTRTSRKKSGKTSPQHRKIEQPENVRSDVVDSVALIGGGGRVERMDGDDLTPERGVRVDNGAKPDDGDQSRRHDIRDAVASCCTSELQLQIVDCLEVGLSDEAIAEELQVDRGTVASERKEIAERLAKLGYHVGGPKVNRRMKLTPSQLVAEPSIAETQYALAP